MWKYVKKYLYFAIPAALFMVGEVTMDLIQPGLMRQIVDEGVLKLEVTGSAKTLLIDRGFDPVYGARPLKRYLQSSAETLIAKEILRGELPAGSTLVLDAENGQLVCHKR